MLQLTPDEIKDKLKVLAEIALPQFSVTLNAALAYIEELEQFNDILTQSAPGEEVLTKTILEQELHPVKDEALGFIRGIREVTQQQGTSYMAYEERGLEIITTRFSFTITVGSGLLKLQGKKMLEFLAGQKLVDILYENIRGTKESVFLQKTNSLLGLSNATDVILVVESKGNREEYDFAVQPKPSQLAIILESRS